MTQIARKDPMIDEAIDILNLHFKRCKNDYAEAFNTLASVYSDFINDELTKCMINPRYYLENYHTVKTEDQGFKTLYPFWDSQEIFYSEIIHMIIEGKPVKVLVLKARQLGLSTVSEGLIFHRTIFNEATNALIVAQDPGQADYLFSMSVRAYENLPWWMRPEVRYKSKGRYMTFATEGFDRDGLNSEIYVEAANKLTGVSVGKSIRCAHMSELSAWPDPKTLTTQIFPTMNAKDELAIMESTARGRQGFWYDFWNKAVNKWGDGSWEWKPIFIEWFRCPDKYSKKVEPQQKFKLKDDERSFRESIIKSTGFLIPDEMFNWKRAKIDEIVALEGDEWSFYQEYPANWMEAFQTTGSCAFPKKKLQRIMETRCCNPRWYGELNYHHGASQPVKLHLTEYTDKTGMLIPDMPHLPPAERDGGRLRVWERPEPGESYYVGADPAMGIEGTGDFSCAQVLKIGRGGAPDVQVAEWRGWINPTPFGHVLVGLATWYNECELALELNSVGEKTYIEVFRILEYPNLFRWKHYDKLKNIYTDYMAWVTNHKTRDLIITHMRERIMEDTVILRSYDLLNEMLDFSQDEAGGRFEGQNTNDDRIMAQMICGWCAHDSDYGKQAAMKPASDGNGVQKYYVIDPLGRITEECDSRDDAIVYTMSVGSPGTRRLVKPGWSVASRVQKKDFNNTDYSPVHDKPGPRQDMHYTHGIPAEYISLSNVFTIDGNAASDDWRAY